MHVWLLLTFAVEVPIPLVLVLSNVPLPCLHAVPMCSPGALQCTLWPRELFSISAFASVPTVLPSVDICGLSSSHTPTTHRHTMSQSGPPADAKQAQAAALQELEAAQKRKRAIDTSLVSCLGFTPFIIERVAAMAPQVQRYLNKLTRRPMLSRLYMRMRTSTWKNRRFQAGTSSRLVGSDNVARAILYPCPTRGWPPSDIQARYGLSICPLVGLACSRSP